MISEHDLRVDLAAAFRLIYAMDMHESVANHLSAAVSEDGKQFLMNRRWMHFGNVCASNLQHLDSDNPDVMRTDQAPDISAWTIHGSIHRAIPSARVVLHVHSTYATVLSTLQDSRILPLDNNTARFYNRVAYDNNFSGIANNEAEGCRIRDAFAGQNVLMMGNHGVTVLGNSVAEAFDTLYYLEKACKTTVLAYSTGKPLNVLNDNLAEKTALSWADFKGADDAHFKQLKMMLDKQDPSYRD